VFVPGFRNEPSRLGLMAENPHRPLYSSTHSSTNPSALPFQSPLGRCGGLPSPRPDMLDIMAGVGHNGYECPVPDKCRRSSVRDLECEIILLRSLIDMDVKSLKGREDAASKDAGEMDLPQSVLTAAGPRMLSYSRPELSEALRARMRDTGLADQREYLAYLAKNPTEMEFVFAALRKDALGPGPDDELFNALERTVIPIAVLHGSIRGDGRIRTCITGAAHPIIAYQVAISFLELLEDVRDNYAVEVLCTNDDRDAEFEDRARSIKASEHSPMERERWERYWVDDGRQSSPRPDLSKMVRFIGTGRSSGPWPKDVDLLICLDPPSSADHRALNRWARTAERSLRDDGLLLLSSSAGAGPSSIEGFQPVRVQKGLYQKMMKAR